MIKKYWLLFRPLVVCRQQQSEGGSKLIKLENVNKVFGSNHVLKDINLEVKEGEKLVILGPSGSGKSTTIRCMNYLEVPTSGTVSINGETINKKNKNKIVGNNISMVFQQFNLYPHKTVLENLTDRKSVV